MSQIARFYDEYAPGEWERLDRHRTESALTLRTLSDHLPPPPAAILDVGGGPGRYAIALAQRGYIVTLCDISARSLAVAKEKADEAGVALAGFHCTSATDLASLSDQSFAAVLLMGPLYHLLMREDRERAVGEARRVLRPNGLIFASFGVRYGKLRTMALSDPASLSRERARWEHMLSTGKLPARPESAGDGDWPASGTDWYLALPTEVQPFMEENGFASLDLVAGEGIISRIEDEVNRLQGEAWEAWVDLNHRLGRDPSVFGAAEHLLYVGQKC